MRRRSLTELATSPDLISGIYNYCDRWCERCSFTSRCLVFATEQEDDKDWPESQDINNQAFWEGLSSIFKETREMILEWAAEEGIDLNEVDEDLMAKSHKRHEGAERHPLAMAGKQYADEVTRWFEEFSQTIQCSDVVDDAEEEQSEQVRDASEVIHWYQYQIAVKIIRALWSRKNEDDPEEWSADESEQRDSDGSAKVALVAIDRSIGAWRLMQLSLPETSESIVRLIMQLEKLRLASEREFPEARDFIRPGFDEIPGNLN